MKVYLVTIDQGSYDDYHWWIDSIYSTPEKAEQRKLDILKEIDLIKLDYLNKFGVEYDKDVLKFDSMFDAEVFDGRKYDKLGNRVYTFNHQNPQLEYNTIKVQEREVL